MASISWCLKQKNGIELIEPNDNLAIEYLQEAKITLQDAGDKQTKWQLIIAYYAGYNALYAILMKAGIKSEIHDCSIELMKIIGGFDMNDYQFMVKLKNKRIQAQYYLKNEILENLQPVKAFIFKCEKILAEIDTQKIRNKLNKK